MTPDRTAQHLATVAQPAELIAAKYRVERVVVHGHPTLSRPVSRIGRTT